MLSSVRSRGVGSRRGLNAGGIDATPNGKWLIVVNSATGTIYGVEPTTVTESGNALHTINARFDVAPPPFPGSDPADPTLKHEAVRASK
jgi:hypothetical protein